MLSITVTNLKIGQAVGVGAQRNSCSSCGYCKDGVDQLCPKFETTYDPHFGGYATSITVNSRFAFPIPDGIPLEVAGPLLCAGITTYAPLARWTKPGQKVGIVGVGGLGHLGVQYAAAMGCQTWAISTSTSKEAEARHFGAQHFLVSTKKEDMAAQAGTFDFILCTASSNYEVRDYLQLLKARGTLCIVGVPSMEEKLSIYPFDIILGERQLVGSMIGGSGDMKSMLAFSAAHKCFPQCEVIPFIQAQEGIEKVLKNAARYRVVLKIDGFRESQA